MGCIVCLLVDWPITGGEEWGLICGEGGGYKWTFMVCNFSGT